MVRADRDRRRTAPSLTPTPATLAAVVLEGQLAFVLAEEVEEALVVGRLHVEHPRHDLVVPARLLQPAAHQVAQVAARDLPPHVERIDGRPERLVLVDEALVEVVDDRAPPLARGTRSVARRRA